MIIKIKMVKEINTYLTYENVPGNKFLNKHIFKENYEKLDKCTSDLDCVFDVQYGKCIAISKNVDSEDCIPSKEGGECFCKNSDRLKII